MPPNFPRKHTERKSEYQKINRNEGVSNNTRNRKSNEKCIIRSEITEKYCWYEKDRNHF